MTVRRTDSEARARPGPFPAIESSRERERLRTVVLPAHDDLASLGADRIVEVVSRATRARGKAVLGLATGSTPLGVYRELIRRHQAGDIDFSRVITFNLDEYYPIALDNPHSYYRYMWENFFENVNIKRENVHIPDGTTVRDRLAEACAAYEQAIADAGGIDFQILGIGKTGHVGFNEPGSSAASRTRLVTLDTLTRKDAAADFFGEENVPREAITMGVATILEAREIALIATGEHKAGIVSRALEGRHSPEAMGERECDRRRVHDERQHRRVRSRCAAPSRFRGACGGNAHSGHCGGAARACNRRGQREEKAAGRCGSADGAGSEAFHSRVGSDCGARRGGHPSECGAVPQPPLLSDRRGPETPARRRGYRDREAPVRRGATGFGIRRRRSLRSARHASHLQDGGRA